MTGDNDNDKIRKDRMYIPSGGAFLLRFVELCKKSSLGTPSDPFMEKDLFIKCGLSKIMIKACMFRHFELKKLNFCAIINKAVCAIYLPSKRA